MDRASSPNSALLIIAADQVGDMTSGMSDHDRQEDPCLHRSDPTVADAGQSHGERLAPTGQGSASEQHRDEDDGERDRLPHAEVDVVGDQRRLDDPEGQPDADRDPDVHEPTDEGGGHGGDHEQGEGETASG